MEVTDHEASNASTEAEAEKSRLSSGKATVDVKQGPGENRQPAPPQQQGFFKGLLSHLPFFKSGEEHWQPDSPANSNHRGLSFRQSLGTWNCLQHIPNSQNTARY